MNPTLPIPTDNIYKFACLFGLALILVSVFSFASNYTITLDRKVRYSELVIGLESKSERSKADEDLLTLNKKLLEISTANERVLNYVLGAATAVGVILSFYGATNWHQKIQQRDDAIAALQIEKLRLEIVNLEATRGQTKQSSTPVPNADSFHDGG